ncbi:MAG: glutathione S-transferase [Comamonadaceae bacterium]|nr:MAG: glutathione S-transferase [Comamonadaceae bacterium]
MQNQPLTLFGAPVGLWTGKIRSYLRKQGIPFVERLPSDPVFQGEVMPAVKRFINPVIRFADGMLVQDTADIIDYLERKGYARFSVYPQQPLQRIVALTLDLFGGEGQVRAAMHYRWSYRDYNDTFLRHEFGLAFRAVGLPQAAIDQQLDGFMGYLNAYLPKLGITPTSAPAVEAAYGDLLAALDAHFRVQPYLLGGRPTVADFGFIANLFAHLGRDPYPADMMKRKAPSVFRWTERMMANDPDTPEFPNCAFALPEADEVPATIGPVLRLMAQDYLPELKMAVAYTDAWLAQQGDIASGTPVGGKPKVRNIGQGRFHLRGVELETLVWPYSLYMLQRVTDAYEKLDPQQQPVIHDYFASTGLEDLLTLRATRRVERRDHIEIWA